MDATCTTDGAANYKCSNCGYTTTETLTKIGHSYGEWTVIKEATAEETGLKQRVCSVCQNVETETIQKSGIPGMGNLFTNMKAYLDGIRTQIERLSLSFFGRKSAAIPRRHY